MKKATFLLFLFLLLVSCTNIYAATPSLSKKQITLYVGESYKLKGKNMGRPLKWTSSAKSVAAVNRGVVTAKKKGRAVIKAVSSKKSGRKTVKQSAACKVIVKNVSLSQKKINLSQYEFATLSLDCGGRGPIKWSSSAPAVAVVCGTNGRTAYINSKKAGSAIITATYMHRSYQCIVTVDQRIESMTAEDLLKQNPLYGKTIAVYGSSNEMPHASTGTPWVTYLKEELNGIATVLNRSVNGNTLAKSIDRIAADPDLSSYDIILVTTIRNSYRGALPLPCSEDPVGFLNSLYTLHNLIAKGRQTVYIASCLPYSSPFRSLSDTMSVYDGLVWKVCRKLGFKYLDMHSWIGISNTDATDLTTDGMHYYGAVHQTLAKCCRAALENGGEVLRPYQIKVSGRELLQAIHLNDELVSVAPEDEKLLVYSIDTDFNVNLYLKLTALTDIEEQAEILLAKDGVHFYPEDSCLYGYGAFGAFRLLSDGRVITDRPIPAGTAFVVQINAKAMYDVGI